MGKPTWGVFALLLFFPAQLFGLQKPGTINLSQSCFDSLPYGQTHTCEILVISKNKIPVEVLYTTVAQAMITDTLEIADRESTATRVLLQADLQTPKGRCAKPFLGLDSLKPLVAIHFDANRRGKDTGAALLIRSSAISAEGVKANQLAIAVCMSGYYLNDLDFPDLR